jgi:hypothetical protein
MISEQFLEAGMQAERRPSDLLAWIDSVHEEISATDEGRKRFRLQKGAAKLLMEEVRPLALFGIWLSKEHPELTVQPMANKDTPYDGILRSPSWTFEQRIEVSQATEGHDEHLRMRHLNEFGRAPSIGKIASVREHGKTAIKETPATAHSSPEIRANVYDLIRTTAEKKLKKSYPQDMWLLIVFDDNVGFAVGQRLREDAVSELRAFFTECILALPWQLGAVFAIGSSGRIVIGKQLISR